MPHLISALQGSSTSQSAIPVRETGPEQGDLEARKKEVESLLKTGGGKRGMEWGTCMVFSCAQDCCLEEGAGKEAKEAKEAWVEELVLVQWEE